MKVIFWGGGGGYVGLFWVSCSEDQNMDCDGVKWIRNGFYDSENPW